MSIDFFKIDKGITLKGQAADPSSPVDGDALYNSTTNKFRFRQNGAWVEIGSGNSETALLYQLLAQNNMEDIAMTSFGSSDEDLIRASTNMTLDTADGSYSGSSAATILYWNGWRSPLSGGSTEIFTETISGTGTSFSNSGGAYLYTDSASGYRTYYKDLASGISSSSDIYMDFTMKITSETALVAFGSDVTTGHGIYMADGSRAAELSFIRQTNSSGARQVAFVNATTVLTDTDTAASARFNIDWTQSHRYQLFKRGDSCQLWIDGVYQGRVSMASGASTALKRIYWGQTSTGATTANSNASWYIIGFKAYPSVLETKVLNYRGTYAFEGDGNPTSSTSTGTVQALSSGYFLEDNWVQWTSDSSGAPTLSTQNTGTLRAARRIALSGAQRQNYTITQASEYMDGANTSIQARVYFQTVNVASSTLFEILHMRLFSADIRLRAQRSGSNSVLTVGLANSSAFLTTPTGTQAIVNSGETHTFELRKIRYDRVQFLFDGVIQQEIALSDADFSGTISSNLVGWGNLTNLVGGDSLTWDWNYVRFTRAGDPFLPKSPAREFVAILDHTDNEPTVAFSSDERFWSIPVGVNDTGCTVFSGIGANQAGGYVVARIMLDDNISTSKLNSMAILFNASQGTGGLTPKAVKTFTSSDIPAPPANTVWNHGMSLSDGEFCVFGGTEFLVQDLDWTYNSSDSITIINAQVGVPYTVQRVGFSFDRSSSNTDRLDAIEKIIRVIAKRITSTQTITAGTSWVELIFNGELEDTTNSYDPTTGRFTAPEDGSYLITYGMDALTGGTVPTQLQTAVQINGNSGPAIPNAYAHDYMNQGAITGTNAGRTMKGSAFLKLNKGDYISVWAQCTSQNVSMDNFSTDVGASRIEIQRINPKNS